MQLTYHCITKPDEWEIRVTEAGDAVRLPKSAKDYRTRDRERAVEWMTDNLLDEDDCGPCSASIESECMIQDAEVELAMRLWDQAEDDQREAWCEEAQVSPPRSSQELRDLPLLVEEMLDLEA